MSRRRWVCEWCGHVWGLGFFCNRSGGCGVVLGPLVVLRLGRYE